MPESSPSVPVTFARRTTIALLPVIVLAGCRWGPDEDQSEAVEEEQDADAALVKTAVESVERQAGTVTAVAREHIGLSTPLAALTAMHAAHLRLLSSDPARTSPSETVPSETVPEDSRTALASVRREEARLQAQLADLAISAVSGTLARALASMSASIAAHLVALPEVARGQA